MPAVRDVGARFVAIHRARLPRYSTLGAVHRPLPRATTAGPLAESTAAAVRNAG